MKLRLTAFIKDSGHKDTAREIFKSDQIDQLLDQAHQNWRKCYSDDGQAQEAAEWVIERYEAETNNSLHGEAKDELMRLVYDHFTRTEYPKVK